MKMGAKVGKVDCAYNEIRVGDTIRNKHTGAEYVVTSYGSLDNGRGTTAKWDPDDYRVVRSWDEALKEDRDAAVAAVMDPGNNPLNGVAAVTVSDEPEPEVPEGIDDPDGGDVKDGEDVCGPKECTLAEFLKECETARRAGELVEEMRSLGYKVTATKRISVVVNL